MDDYIPNENEQDEIYNLWQKDQIKKTAINNRIIIYLKWVEFVLWLRKNGIIYE